MSVRAALAFIEHIRRDPELKKQLETVAITASDADMVALGAQAGYAFSVEDLQAAFRYDWGMRWVRYASNHSAVALE